MKACGISVREVQDLGLRDDRETILAQFVFQGSMVE